MENNQRQTIVAVFRSWKDAEHAITKLHDNGFTHEEISIMSKDRRADSKTYDDNITDGWMTGGTIGGIGGLLLSAGALAIPGIGPVIAAGPLAATITGAVAGGLVGGLIDLGIPSEDSRHYEQSLAQGHVLALVSADSSSKVNQASNLLRQNGAESVKVHAKK